MTKIVNRRRELDLVNMLIRALSNEMAQQQNSAAENGSSDAVLVQMQEAMFQLRLRKLYFSAGLRSHQR
jgi:hypothetical protein